MSQSSNFDRFEENRSLNATSLDISLADSENYSFGIVGDLHVGESNTSRLRNILQLARANNDEFMVLLGDLADKGDLNDFEAIDQALTDEGYGQKTLVVIGNHDIFNSGWEYYRNLYGATHYSFSVGNAQFFGLDTADGTVGEEQSQWLEDELKRSTQKNKFIITHYLPIIPGQTTYLKLANEVEATNLMAMATQNGVRAWLGGHYHSYAVDTIEGVQYVVAGGGGGRRMPPVWDYFYVRVIVRGTDVSYEMVRVD